MTPRQQSVARTSHAALAFLLVSCATATPTTDPDASASLDAGPLSPELMKDVSFYCSRLLTCGAANATPRTDVTPDSCILLYQQALDMPTPYNLSTFRKQVAACRAVACPKWRECDVKQAASAQR